VQTEVLPEDGSDSDDENLEEYHLQFVKFHQKQKKLALKLE